MKTLTRLFTLTTLSLGLSLPLTGCIVETVETETLREGIVEPLDGDGVEIEGEGRIDD